MDFEKSDFGPAVNGCPIYSEYVYVSLMFYTLAAGKIEGEKLSIKELPFLSLIWSLGQLAAEGSRKNLSH